jgi:serine/threonine-protein kinase
MSPAVRNPRNVSVPAPAAETTLPRKLGRYTLFDRIGRGGMADIFLATAQTDFGATRLVVVKQILTGLAASGEFSELLITEAKLSALLDHANIVQVHDLGKADGFLYIAMQYVEGFDLDELLRMCTRSKTPLPVQYALLVVTEALRGLDYAHRRTTDDGRPVGIVHRDVSPSNILISLEGEVKLCDFGIAHANEAFGVFADDVIKGKAGYMSPEHARGESIDARADVFAIGIVLWELLAGRRLYRTGNEQGASLLAKARAAEIPDLPSRGLPHESDLFAIVKKALTRNRDERYASADEFLHDLLDYIVEAELVASPLRFGQWLLERFGEQLVEQRRARERAAKALAAAEAEAAALGTEASSDPSGEISAEMPTRKERIPPGSLPPKEEPARTSSPPGDARAEAQSRVTPLPPSGPAVTLVKKDGRPASIWVRIAGLLAMAIIVYFFAAHC